MFVKVRQSAVMGSNVLFRIKRQADSSLKGISARSQHTTGEGWSSVERGLWQPGWTQTLQYHTLL